MDEYNQNAFSMRWQQVIQKKVNHGKRTRNARRREMSRKALLGGLIER